MGRNRDCYNYRGCHDQLRALLLGAALVGCIFRVAEAVDISQCDHPLGMETGQIPDHDITASTSFDNANVGPHQARLKQENLGGAWCPRNIITQEANEWLEIDLHRVYVITSTSTQGRFGNGFGVEYSENYLLEYWRPTLSKWVRYKNFKGESVMKGNANTYIESRQFLDPPIWASKIRFLPYAVHQRTVCMRVEIYGCPYTDGILAYTMPQGDKRASREFFDATYDGHWSDELRRGLGQLTDGRLGPESFKMSHHDVTKDVGWVGWKNETRPDGQMRDHVEIKFEFDQVREFTAVHVYCNNQFTKEVQMFESVTVMFSIGGKFYEGVPIVYENPQDRVLEFARNITIKLHHRIGKFVKLRFKFAAKWMMISEISFDSEIAHGNFTPETPPTTELPRQYREPGNVPREISPNFAEIPVTTARRDEPTYMAVIIGILTAVILLLAVAIFLIVARHRQRKGFASPLAAKNGLPQNGGTHHHPHHLGHDSAYGASEKDPSLMGYRVDDLEERYSNAKLTSLPRDLNDRLLGADMRLDDYQEPFREMKYRDVPHAAYYGYSTVIIDNKDLHDSLEQSDATYDYAVPMPVPSGSSDQDSVFSKSSSSRGSAKACLQSFFPPPPPPPANAPPCRGANNLTYSSPPSPDLVRHADNGNSKRSIASNSSSSIINNNNGSGGSKRLHRYA